MADVARTIEELPILKDEHVRLIHKTAVKEKAEEIAKTGLNYKQNCIIDQTVLAFADASDAERYLRTGRTPYHSLFRHPGRFAVVLDVSFEEYRTHMNLVAAPGIVPAECVVGIIESNL